MVFNFHLGAEIHHHRGRISVRRFSIWKLRDDTQPCRWEANHRVQRTAGFTQQHKRIPPPCTARTTGSACTWAGSSGLALNGRVDTRLNSGLELFYIGKVGVAGGGTGGGLTVERQVTVGGKHLLGEVKTAVAPQGQLLAIAQRNGNCATGTGDQLLTGKYPIPFTERPARSIACHRKHFADHLTDDTHQSSHDSILTTAADHRRHVCQKGQIPFEVNRKAPV